MFGRDEEAQATTWCLKGGHQQIPYKPLTRYAVLFWLTSLNV